jgi:hypothetical protein
MTEYEDYSAQKLPRPFRYTSITRYRLVESENTPGTWYVQIKSMFFGWHTLAARTGIERAVRYMDLDRAAREPQA